MEIQISFKLRIILVLLSAILVLNAFSLFFFFSIDHIVNHDLYDYRLQYSNEWWVPYHNRSMYLIASIAVSMIAAGLAVLNVITYVRTRGRISPTPSYPLLVVAAVGTGFSIYFFGNVDYVVHGELYGYGLQFSLQWANKYWMYAHLLLGLQGLSLAATIITIMLIFLGSRGLIRVRSTRLVCYALIFIGIAALALSINYQSQVAAFTGLGLLFWGILIWYVTPEEYAKRSVVEANALSAYATLDEMIVGLGYQGTAVYLPPKYLEDIGVNKVYLDRSEKSEIPMTDQIEQENAIFVKNPDGLLLVPPGNDLTRLFERRLATSFVRVDLKSLQESLPKLLIEDLEIVTGFGMQVQGNTVRVTIENSIYKNVHREIMRLSRMTRSLGCPISSAIACILTNVTGRPVVIVNEEASADGKRINTEYSLLKEAQGGRSQ
jgi:hypothetical protein